MKRAAIIITDANAVEAVEWFGGPSERWYIKAEIDLSEQLLVDLRLLVEPYPDIDEWNSAAARVRALLPGEEACDG